jgi:hypothetical protein
MFFVDFCDISVLQVSECSFTLLGCVLRSPSDVALES